MDTRYLGALIDQAKSRGVKELQLTTTPAQSGFADLAQHNQAVEDIATDVYSILGLVETLQTERRSYVEGCRDLEGWAEDRILDLKQRRSSQGGVTLEFNRNPHLPVVASIPQIPIRREEMACWGRQVASRGPWRQLAAEGESRLLGSTVGGRWRMTYSQNVSISEVGLTTGPEIFAFYRVIRATVTEVGADYITIDKQLPSNMPDVIVDVVQGFHHGFWFTGRALSNRVTGCQVTLEVGEEVTVAIPTETYDLGRGIFEVEENDGPIHGNMFDIVLAATSSVAWVGLPAPQLSFKLYAPEAEIYTIGEVEPTEIIKLNVDAIVPTGATITYDIIPETDLERANARLVQDPVSISGNAFPRTTESTSKTVTSKITTSDRKPVPRSSLFGLIRRDKPIRERVEDYVNGLLGGVVKSSTTQVSQDAQQRVPNSSLISDGFSIIAPAALDRNPIRIEAGRALLSRDLFSSVHCVEEGSLDRYMRMKLSWDPIVDSTTVASRGLGFNPNKSVIEGGSSLALWCRWTDPSTEEGTLDESRWLYSGNVENTDWGMYIGTWSFDGTIATISGSVIETEECLRLGPSSSAHLRSSNWQTASYQIQRVGMRFVANSPVTSDSSDGWEDKLYQGDCAEWRVREGYDGTALSIRILPWNYNEHLITMGIYKLSMDENGISTTTLATSAIPCWSPFYETSVWLGGGSPVTTNPVFIPESAIPVVASSTLLTENGTQYQGSDLLEEELTYRGWLWNWVYVIERDGQVDCGLHMFDFNNFPIPSQTFFDTYLECRHTVLTGSFAGELPGGGGGVSFRNGIDVTLASLDIDNLEIYTKDSELMPIRVEARLEDLTIPPDVLGLDTRNLQPERISEVLLPIEVGKYRLSATPVSRWAGTQDLTVYAMDFEGTRGEALYAGSAYSGKGRVSISGNILTLRGVEHSGSIQVEYWGIPQATGKVPFTSNVTDYLSPSRTRTLRPLNDNIESQHYYPVVEYLHQGRDLFFGTELDSVKVAYDTWATFLKVRATIHRGINPCRSPRIRSGYWELA